MSKSMNFLESNATPEENSFNYRVEWDDILKTVYNNSKDPFDFNIEHRGPGEIYFFGNFDNAWDEFTYRQKNPSIINLRLIKIDPSTGREKVYASK